MIKDVVARGSRTGQFFGDDHGLHAYVHISLLICVQCYQSLSSIEVAFLDAKKSALGAIHKPHG